MSTDTTDTKARDNAADTFSRSMRALNSMELADLPPELDQDARDIARIIQDHGKGYDGTEYGDMTAPLLESLARLVQAAKAADRLAVLQSLCAQVYQAAGAFGMPERVLDVLSDAANGDPIRHANILPVDPPAHEARIAKLEQDNARLRDALMDALSQGVEHLPIGDPCEGFDYKTGCPGHAQEPQS